MWPFTKEAFEWWSLTFFLKLVVCLRFPLILVSLMLFASMMVVFPTIAMVTLLLKDPWSLVPLELNEGLSDGR